LSYGPKSWFQNLKCLFSSLNKELQSLDTSSHAILLHLYLS